MMRILRKYTNLQPKFQIKTKRKRPRKTNKADKKGIEMENTKKEEFISTKIVKRELDKDSSSKIKSKKSDILKVTKSKENKKEKILDTKIEKPVP